MAAVELERMRNVGILGHGGSGKTSLAEAMLFSGGATQRLGRVTDGSSVFDYEPEEIHRQISISTAFHTLNWKKNQLTLIDTPGYATFLADTINCMRAFGGAVFVFNPSAGIRVETERLWDQANQRKMGRLVFSTKMDREKAKIREGLDAIFTGLEAKGVFLQLPIGREELFKGVVDLVTQKAFIFEGDTGKFAQTDVPEELKKEAEESRVQMLEAVAETDDALLEKYLGGEELSVEELRSAIRAAVQAGRLFPVFFGSATRLMGVPQLLDAVIDYLPSPAHEGETEGLRL
jgi:elongation factor G